MIKFLLVTALAAATLTGTAGAQNAPRGPMRADTNQDGKVSRDEMRAEADQRFDRLDTNKDGFLDAAELAAQRGFGRGPRGDMPPPPGA